MTGSGTVVDNMRMDPKGVSITRNDNVLEQGKETMDTPEDGIYEDDKSVKHSNRSGVERPGFSMEVDPDEYDMWTGGQMAEHIWRTRK